MLRVLFICRTNSTLSPMAEGLAKEMWRENAKVKSAGLRPLHVNPYAVRVMKELEIDISKKETRTLNDINPKFLAKLDYVILLGLDERPKLSISSRARVVSWPMPFVDREASSKKTHLNRERVRRFRILRDNLKKRLVALSKRLI